MKYIYSAVFTPCETGYTASIPDLPGCVTTGKTLQDAIEQITDAASGWLVVAEDEKLTIKPCSNQQDLSLAPDQLCSLISVDTVKYRSLTDTRCVRKNVSIPAWLATLADRQNINVSQVLQEALIAKMQ